ncbi:helix-turn-helix domain-containing protein [Thermus sp. PS18]|uniref:helix-turn-helix domain-containing protein n=1 Tax=Thermus sp. PS18 TaxID=2849039 RepID=UPI0022649BE8|nr:helix-turn-helix domain-containing protein [Thermus sp. PS18]UZX15689.1 helix-turn-helix domain-containing protein [Thermus sp. PS18]
MKEKSKSLDRLALSPEQVAQALGISVFTLYKLLHTGRIRHVRVGRRILIPIAALEAFLNGEEVGNAAS